VGGEHTPDELEVSGIGDRRTPDGVS